MAAMGGHTDVVAELVAARASVNMAAKMADGSVTPLHISLEAAARTGSVEIIEVLGGGGGGGRGGGLTTPPRPILPQA